ncbi:MAG: mechanosensitive ion channel family protein [Pseudomonadota bacterium]
MTSVIYDQFVELWDQALATVPALIIALGVVLLTWLVAKGAGVISRKIIGQTQLRDALRNLLQKIIKLIIWIVGLMIAAVVVFPDFTPANLIAGLGIGTVAIGFAFKDIFENFFAGVLIMLREKMRIGDVVQVGDILGTVEYVSLRETHIRAFAGELTILPNTILFQSPVEVWTDAPKRRFEVVVGVAYDSDLDHAARTIRGAVESCEFVDKDETIYVLADNFNSSSVDFIVRWWAPSSGAGSALNKDQVIRAIKAALDAAKIEIPFPYVTHTFKEEVPVVEKAPEGS